jgi:predicted regulator of Ras-like GTPase activity (Roadblock/LC7/MglB family)
MNEEMLNIALRNALAEIKNSITDINWSFILTNDGTVISSDENTVDQNMAKAASSFQVLADKAAAIGGLDNMLITGEKSKVHVSSINDMYLIAGLNKNADLVYFRTLTNAVLPTVLKVLDSITSISQSPTPFKSTPPIPYSPIKPAPARPVPSELESEEKEEQEAAHEEYAETQELEEPKEPEPLELGTQQRMDARGQLEIPSQQLIVDRFSGLMVKADTVQLDADVLKRWSALLNVDEVNEVDIETFIGKTARCKAKLINDSKLEGRGLIRIPEKTCQQLDVRRGELVRVKPVVPQESE